MANIHVLTNSRNECVLKCYITSPSGGNCYINLASTILKSDETFDRDNAIVTIRALYWGTKNNKNIDVSRVITYANNELHGHYYLVNSGVHDFVGFVDDVYSNKDILIQGDGEYHVIIKLAKTAGYTTS